MMIMNKLRLAVAVLAGVSTLSQGALIASESFETDVAGTGGIYAHGNVGWQGVVGGNSGFDAENLWLNDTGAVKANVSRIILDTHSGVTGTAGTTHGAALISSGHTRNSNRLLSANPETSSSYYFSGLCRLNGATVLDNGDKCAMGLMNSIFPNSFDVSTGIHFGYHKENDVSYLAVYAGGEVYNLLALDGRNLANIYQVVLKLDVNDAGEETLAAWYARTGDAELTEALPATVVGDIWQDAGDLDTFVLQTEEGRDGSTQIARFDEMRFGTVRSDVTAIP